MSNAIDEKLLNDAIAAVEIGDVEGFKSTWESDFRLFSDDDQLHDNKFAHLAASRNCSSIVEYLMTKSNFGYLGNAMSHALDGYAKGGHSDAFMKLLDRLMPILKHKDSKISFNDPIRLAIEGGHIDLARKLISILSLKPYAEFCNFGSFSIDYTPYRTLLSVCLSANCVELLDELFEKCSIAKSEIKFDSILLVAKALNYDAFVKKIEEWKEKYPYQSGSEKPQSTALVLGSLGAAIGYNAWMPVTTNS